MKKLSLLKLNDPKVLKEEELKKVKGGSCQSWACQCHGKDQETLDVDNLLETRDQQGYHG